MGRVQQSPPCSPPSLGHFLSRSPRLDPLRDTSFVGGGGLLSSGRGPGCIWQISCCYMEKLQSQTSFLSPNVPLPAQHWLQKGSYD